MQIKNIEDIGLLFGIFLYLLMAVGQLLLKKKDRKNYLLITIFLLVAVAQFFLAFPIFSAIDNWHALYRYVDAAGAISIFCAVAFTYILFLDYIEPGSSKNRKKWLHFIIPLLIGLLFLVFTDYPDTTVAPEHYRAFLYNHNARARFLSVFSILYLFFYFIAIIIKYRKRFREAHDKHRKNLSLVLSFSILTLVIGSLSIFFYSNTRLAGDIYKLRFTILAVFIFLSGYRNPFLLNIRKLESYKDYYEKSYVGNIDTDDVVTSLEKMMDRDRLFLEENLTITAVAGKLGITRHQLSEILNLQLHKSFSRYISEKRLDFARQELTDDPSKKILAVAMDCGYGTISNFNSSFKKMFGVSPGEYRKSRTMGKNPDNCRVDAIPPEAPGSSSLK